MDEMEKLRLALDAMTAERDEWKAAATKNHPNPADHRYWEGRYRDENATNERLTAERDALVGAVIEQATWQVRSSVPGHMMVCDTERICEAIRALTPADAISALDHLLAQAKAEGMASLIEPITTLLFQDMDDWERVADKIKALILATAEKEAQHG